MALLNLKKELTLDEIATCLFLLPNKVQFCHHSTTSYSAHKSLDELYEATSSLKDEIIEKIMGYCGMRYKTLALTPITSFKEAMINEVLNEGLVFAKKLQEWAVREQYPDIENLAQSYSGAFAQAKYLSTLK